MSNKIFSRLKKMGYITEKQFKYFSCEYRKTSYFGKLYFLPKLIKSYIMSKDDQLFRIAAHTQRKMLGFLNYHLKSLMQKWWSYIKDSGDFIKNTRNYSEQELKTFLRSLNEFHTDIKFTYEPNKETIAFPGLKVSNKNSTNLYVKSTDHHQCFHYLSSHSNHTKRSVLK